MSTNLAEFDILLLDIGEQFPVSCIRDPPIHGYFA
jgi:hypothetical protein